MGSAIIQRRPHNKWIAYANGIAVSADVTAEDLARALETYAAAIRAGSIHAMEFPPQIAFGNIPCTFKRSSVPCLDKPKSAMEVG